MIGSEESHDFELGRKEQDSLFILILISIFCLQRRNRQPEAENVDQNEEEQPIILCSAHSEDVSSKFVTFDSNSTSEKLRCAKKLCQLM